jgi:hypothetical protein
MTKWTGHVESIHCEIDVDVQTVIGDLAKLGDHRLQFVL